MAGPRRSEEARFLLLTRNGPSCLKQHSSVPHSALVKQWVAAALCIDDKPVEKKIRIPAKSEFSSAVTYDPIVQKFITILMRDGKKEKTREIVEQVLENIKMKQIENYHRATTDAEKAMVVTDPLKIFHGAVENCKPLLILKTIVKGGSSYRVPVYCHERRRLRVGINFIIKTCDTRKRKVPLSTVLATEILQAYNNEGNAVGKKHQLHKECEAQRAFAHYRWK